MLRTQTTRWNWNHDASCSDEGSLLHLELQIIVIPHAESLKIKTFYLFIAPELKISF